MRKKCLKLTDEDVQKALLAIKRNKNIFFKSNLIISRGHKKGCGY